VKQVMEATGGGAAAAIDFVGSPKTMEFGVNILRKGGKLVMVGLYDGAHPISTVLFPFKMMPAKAPMSARSMIFGSSLPSSGPARCRRSRSRRDRPTRLARHSAT
jgi:threonine dehydrogenase-like Zn-dependent dehydrogenase